MKEEVDLKDKELISVSAALEEANALGEKNEKLINDMNIQLKDKTMLIEEKVKEISLIKD